LYSPDELVIDTLLPALRQLVVHQLRARGLSQSRISTLVGVTQASVSNYLSAPSEKAYESLKGFSLSKEEADLCAADLADAAQRGPVDAVAALAELRDLVLGSGAACPLHRASHPQLIGCEVCMSRYHGSKGDLSDATSDVSRAVAMVEGSPTFYMVMPEVSVNIAVAPGGAETASAVVAVPGRVVRVGTRAKAVFPPRRGASTHVARVLLEVRKVRPEVRACMNLRHDAKMGRVLATLKLRPLYLPRVASGKGDPTVEALERALKKRRRRFDVVVDEGGKGTESNTYLFGESAERTAELALRASRLYSAG
jgi:XRE family transcriptional regulator, thiamine biosynthesis regulator